MKKTLLNLGAWLGIIHIPSEPMERKRKDRDSIYFVPDIKTHYPDQLMGLAGIFMTGLLLASCATIRFDSARVEAVEGYKESCLYLLSYQDDKGRNKMVYMQDDCNQFYVNDSIFFNEQIVLK